MIFIWQAIIVANSAVAALAVAVAAAMRIALFVIEIVYASDFIGVYIIAKSSK